MTQIQGTPPKVKLPREQEDWEFVSEGTRGYTQRLPVPGGWIYRTVVYGAVAMCFVPRPLGGTPMPAVTLAECPIGLFTCRDELCLKTEYGNNQGRIDAYIVSSGEFFWGDPPQTIESQRKQMVTPLASAGNYVAQSLLDTKE